MKKFFLITIPSVFLLTFTLQAQTDLFFSEYIEGSSNNKAIEIYNPTGSSVDLSNYTLGVIFNGGPDIESNLSLTGTLNAYTVFVICHTSAAVDIKNEADLEWSSLNFNGDDHVFLLKNGSSISGGATIIDLIGTPLNSGNFDDPGSKFEDIGSGNDTQNNTLIRNGLIQDGSTSGFGSDQAKLGSEWTSYSQDTFSNLGRHDFAGAITITGDAGWRLLSLPITSGDVSDVSDDSPVQGITGGSDASRDANFYIYDNSGAWEEPTNATTAWGDGYGFAMYFYNNTTNGSSALPVTLDASGSEPGSNVTVNLYGGAANRYTLVGNPFASNINTNSITVTGGSIQNNISFWNDAGSTYSAQDRTGPYIIAPWQGFFVETSDASASSITIPITAKTITATSGTFFSKVADIRGDINFALSSETTNDEAIRLSFRANATPDWDLDDASKLTPLLTAYATLGFATNDMVKSVESLPYRLEEEVTLPMQLDLVGVEGEFSLGWDGLETIPDEWEFVLHDYEQGTSVNLRDIDEYTFEAEPEVASKRNPLSVLSMPAKSMAKASQGERFGLTVSPASVGNEEELSPYSFTLDQNYPNPFNPSTTITYSLEQAGKVSLSIYNALGQRVTQLVNKSQSPGRYNVQWDASVAPTGIYYYRLAVGDVSLTRKMTLIK